VFSFLSGDSVCPGVSELKVAYGDDVRAGFFPIYVTLALCVGDRDKFRAVNISFHVRWMMDTLAPVLSVCMARPLARGAVARHCQPDDRRVGSVYHGYGESLCRVRFLGICDSGKKGRSMWLNTAGRRCGITPSPKNIGNDGLNDGRQERRYLFKAPHARLTLALFAFMKSFAQRAGVFTVGGCVLLEGTTFPLGCI